MDDPKDTAYQAVRAHELMLNEAVSRFEHASLAPLIVLNGGAIVAFLTLLGALLGKDSGRHPNLLLSGLAAGAWVLGLLAAALAIAAATNQQRAISAAHRMQREALEDVLLGDDAIAGVLRGPWPVPTVPDKPTRREQIDDVRSQLRTQAGSFAGQRELRWWLSVAMFVAGAALALAAILVGA